MERTVSQQLIHEQLQFLVRTKQANTTRQALLDNLPPMSLSALRRLVTGIKQQWQARQTRDNDAPTPVNAASVLSRYLTLYDATDDKASVHPLDVDNLQAIQWLEAFGNDCPSEAHITQMTRFIRQANVRPGLLPAPIATDGVKLERLAKAVLATQEDTDRALPTRTLSCP